MLQNSVKKKTWWYKIGMPLTQSNSIVAEGVTENEQQKHKADRERERAKNTRPKTKETQGKKVHLRKKKNTRKKNKHKGEKTWRSKIGMPLTQSKSIVMRRGPSIDSSNIQPPSVVAHTTHMPLHACQTNGYIMSHKAVGNYYCCCVDLFSTAQSLSGWKLLLSVVI